MNAVYRPTPQRRKSRCSLALKDIVAVVPPPPKPLEIGGPEVWKTVEHELGVKLPTDYKQFVLAYGTGIIGDFLMVVTPYAKSQYLNLVLVVKALSAINRELKESEGDRFPFSIFPDSHGLLPWGKDQNGNGYYWLTKGKPNQWPVVVRAARDPRWQQVAYSMTTFLAKALQREIKCEVWPKDFPDKRKAKHFQFKSFES
jgi:hypothetical protein